MMAVVSGVVCIAAGPARLGFITELLSKPIRYGYMNGIALTVIDQPVAEAVRLWIDSEWPAGRPPPLARRCWTARPTGRRWPSAPARWR
jgi:hypothetical protein